MLIRIDARRFTDSVGMHAALSEALGLGPEYGKNLDALVDVLTDLDHPRTRSSRLQVFPGQVVLLVLEHVQGLGKEARAQCQALLDAAAFVNWRRLEKEQPPVVAIAYQHG
jgi:hypothetical protein